MKVPLPEPKHALGLVLACATILPAHAAEIIATEVPGAGFVAIMVGGPIESGDAQRFADAIAPFFGMAGLVALESPGGALMEGLDVAAQVNMAGFSTLVAEGSECFSACALIWIAGAERHLSEASIIGVHAAYTLTEEGEALTSGSGNASVGGFLNEIGLPVTAIHYMTAAGADAFEPITPGIARLLGIDVWEHRGERIISPVEVPTAHRIAWQSAELLGMAHACAAVLNVDVTSLEGMGRQRLQDGHDAFGGEVFAELLPMTVDAIRAAQGQRGAVGWCIDTEGQLRAEGLPIGIDGPSFDCARASTPTELGVCASPDLWALDRGMAGLYGFLRETEDPASFELTRADQAAWIERRDRCGSDVECLARTYRLRIAELGF